MPQHWAGRSGSSPWFLLAASLAIVLAGATVQPDVAALTASRTGAAAAAVARLELGHRDGAAGATAQATRFGGNGRWETGTLVIPGTLHEDAQVFLYVAQRHGSNWSAALEGSSDFALLAEQGHAALVGTPSAELLATTTASATGDGSASLSLPWADGKTWRLTGGPHSNNGSSTGRWSSLDFAGPEPGMSVKVRAARGGIVVRPCANLVQVRHSGGWTTSYYHLKDVAVRAGQSVARGAFLGYTSTAAKCGGRATAPHVHFSLLKNGSYVNIAGHTIGGWTVREGSLSYLGCLVKGDEQRCAPNSSIYNHGSIGNR